MPDLSDVQVIVRTTYPGQAPQIVEDQVTYPLTTTMLSVPGAKTVRGYSFFGDSFVYVLFDDGTDLVLGALARARIPEPGAGPPAGGARSPRSAPMRPASAGSTNTHSSIAPASSDLAQLRALQDWFLKYELKIGAQRRGGRDGRRHGAPVPGRRRSGSAARLRHSAGEGGRRRSATPTARPAARCSSSPKPNTWFARAAISSRSTTSARIPVVASEARHAGAAARRRPRAGRARDAPRHRRARRRGRSGRRRHRHALRQERAGDDRRGEGQARAAEARAAAGRRDRPHLRSLGADRARHRPPADKLVEEFVVVALVCVVFLFHLRSALVAIVTLPLGVLAAFIVMRDQGVNANIMSLGGIAIAIGAMVDAAHRDDRERAQEPRGVAARARERRDSRESTRSRRSTSVDGHRRRRRRGRARLCSSACSSSRCRSCRCSRWRRRKGGCSRRSLSPRPMRWRRPPGCR